ncbi:alpha/beta hydrolase [Haloferula helveola]
MQYLAILAFAVLGLVSCSTLPGNQTALIRSPEVVSLAREEFGYKPLDRIEIAYATDREKPAGGGTSGDYEDQRGLRVWLGFADLEVKNREKSGRIQLNQVRESGVLHASVGAWDLPASKEEMAGEAEFFRHLNRKLDATKKGDLVIYISGFRMPFSDPLLVSGQFSSLAADNVVFMGYSWPTTPTLTSYFRDIETAEYSSRNLRLLLRQLAAKSSARRIHIFAYSAGTRLAARTLQEINLETRSDSAARQRYRLGQVALVSSDMDRQLFGSFLADDITRACERLLVYRSGKDGILGLSGWLFSRGRLGHVPKDEAYPPHRRDYLRKLDKLDVVDVSDAPFAGSYGGHFYFFQSPWVSSDLLLSFVSDLRPGSRGLVRDDQSFAWKFPADYPERLEAIARERKKR